MRIVLQIVLATGMALSGLPHLACACGCGPMSPGPKAAARQTAPCPYCGHESSPSPSRRPKSCDCSGCEQISAVPSPAAAVVQAPAATGWQLELPAVLALQPIEAPRCLAGVPGVGPPARSDHPSAALPILFEHLLL
jgi:hypothetical protein